MKINSFNWNEPTKGSIRNLWKDPKPIWTQPVPPESNIPQANTTQVMKAKRVDQKVRPIPSHIPAHLKVQRQFPEDPLSNLPTLPFLRPEFTPTTKITTERMSILALDDNKDLLSEEKKLVQYIVVLNERSIAFSEEERGTFRSDYFSDYQMPVVDHVPWQEKNITLP